MSPESVVVDCVWNRDGPPWICQVCREPHPDGDAPPHRNCEGKPKIIDVTGRQDACKACERYNGCCGLLSPCQQKKWTYWLERGWCPLGKWAKSMIVDDACVYRGEPIEGGKWGCLQFGECGGSARSCNDCPKLLKFSDPKFSEQWEDPLQIIDRRREETTALRHMLAGGSAFLVGSGPSAKELPLDLLMLRGVWSMGVNNAAGYAHCDAFVCSDPPSKFSHSIWLDPKVMKFVPTPKMRRNRSKLRQKQDGKFSEMEKRVADCPNVWAYKRWSWLVPDNRFFTADGACWGNHRAGSEKYNQPRTVCTMLLGLRLLYYLGARIIYLVGVDFHMRPDYGYSFNQARDAGASESNNRQFAVVNDWLCQMQGAGVFHRFGLQVFNCFERSGLRAFPYVSFEEAVEQSVGAIEQNPDLAGWYEKK